MLKYITISLLTLNIACIAGDSATSIQAVAVTTTACPTMACATTPAQTVAETLNTAKSISDVSEEATTDKSPLLNVKPYIYTRATIACLARKLDELDKKETDYLTRHQQYINKALQNPRHPLSSDQNNDVLLIKNFSDQALKACPGSIEQASESDCLYKLKVLNAFSQFLDVKWRSEDKEQVKYSYYILNLPSAIEPAHKEKEDTFFKLWDCWDFFLKEAKNEAKSLCNRHQDIAKDSILQSQKIVSLKEDVMLLKCSLDQSKDCKHLSQDLQTATLLDLDGIAALIKPIEEFLAQNGDIKG